MKIIARALLALATISLVACGSASSDLEYLDSRVVRDLALPPDLTQVDILTEFDLPAVFSGTDDDSKAKNKIPVLARVESIKLEGQSDFYWLSIDEPAHNLYQMVKDFWAFEGYSLVMDEPIIGIMQTDWIFKKEGKREENISFLDKLVASNLLSASQEQFKTRIARDAGTGMSQIYISHRGTEYAYKPRSGQTEIKTGNRWRFRPSDTELEVEMLSRLMIYLGLRQVSADHQLEKIKLFAPRASLHADYSEDGSYLLVMDVFTKTWYRTLHQLDRMDFEVVEAEFSFGFGSQGVIRINTNIEVEDSGFFSLFSSKTKTSKLQVDLVISEETHETTRISLQSKDQDFQNSPEGIELLTLLYQYIK